MSIDYTKNDLVDSSQNGDDRSSRLAYGACFVVIIMLFAFNLYTLEWLMGIEISSGVKRFGVVVSSLVLVSILAFLIISRQSHRRWIHYLRATIVISGALFVLGGSLLLGWQAYRIQHVDLQAEFAGASTEVGRAVQEFAKDPGTHNGQILLQALMARNTAFLRPDELWSVRWDSDDQSRADELLQGNFVAFLDPREPNNPTSLVMPEVDWKRDVGNSLSFNLHRQLYLLDLVSAAEKEANPAYLIRAKELALQWMRANPLWLHDLRTNRIFQVRNHLNPMFTWNDDTTSHRVMAHLTLMFRLLEHGLLQPEEAIEFVESFVRHGRILAEDGFYSAQTNHGIMQNRALLVLATVFPELRASSEWTHKAVQRMEQQITRNVTPSGVHRELSVSYHFYVLRNFIYFQMVCEKHGIPLSPDYETRLRSMLTYAAEIVYPDGTAPLFGDTEGGPVRQEFDVSRWPDGPYRRWPEGRFLEDSLVGKTPPPESLRTLWEDAGIVHIRYPAGRQEEGDLDVSLLAPKMRPAHNHFDALSLYVYLGRPLLVGSGYPSGTASMVDRMLATTSHNTVSVDAGNHALGDAHVEEVRVEKLGSGSDRILIARAGHELYSGVALKRDLAVFPRGPIVLVDTASSDAEHTYRQHFHFPSTMNTELAGNQVTVIEKSSGIALARLRSWVRSEGGQLFDAEVEREAGYEITRNGYTEAPSVAYRYFGKGVTFITSVELVGSQRQGVFPPVGDLMEIDTGSKRVVLRYGDAGIHLQ